MNQFAAIPATFERNIILNSLSTTTIPSSTSLPFSSSITGTSAKNRVKLMKPPKSLYILWNEYEFGIGGQQPAKIFFKEERGKDRYKFYKSNIFWSLVVEMVKRDRLANEAIDAIYQAYGYETSVTDIILRNYKKTKKMLQTFLLMFFSSHSAFPLI